MKKSLLYIAITIIVIILFIWFDKSLTRMTPESEYERLTELRREAYNYAVECSNTSIPKVKFEDISWVVVPGNQIRFDAIDGTAYLVGYYSVKDTTIYVSDLHRETFWVLAHEALHAIGYIGHPVIPFRTCRLQNDQNGY